MKINALVVFLIVLSGLSFVQKSNIYLFHGQGSDYRIFSKFQVDTNLFDTVFIRYPDMPRRSSMKDFAHSCRTQIDTTTEYAFVGVSFGGMIVSELSQVMTPVHAIIISSAQNKHEVPWRYKFMKVIPLHIIIPARFYKAGSKIAQPIFEPDRKNEKETFKNMLRDKDPYFLKGVTKMMIKWDYYDYNDCIIHIHGENDHTLPAKRCKLDYSVDNGSHMMLLTRAEEINKIINQILLN